MLTPAECAFFMRNGYVVLRQAMDHELCRYAEDKIWSCMPEHFKRGKPKTWTGNVQDCRTNQEICFRRGHVKIQKGEKAGLIGSDPAILGLISSNPRIVSAVGQLLGVKLGPPRVRGLYSVWPMPKFLSLHQMLGNKVKDGFPQTLAKHIKLPVLFTFPSVPHIEGHPMHVVAVGYLTDASSRGGALHVWPGSHRDIYPQFDSTMEHLARPSYKSIFKRLSLKRPIEVTGRKGDVILFHHRLLHAPSINHRSAPRHALFVDFSREDWEAVARRPPTRHQLWEHWPGLFPYLNSTDWRGSSLVQLPDSFWRVFWTKRPRLREAIKWMTSVKDRVPASMKYVGARERRVGDRWLLVSETDHAFSSNALEIDSNLIFGEQLSVTLDGRLLSQNLQPNAPIRLNDISNDNTKGLLVISGKPAVPLNLRIVELSLPFNKSPVVLRRTVLPEAFIDLLVELGARSQTAA